MTTIMDAVEEYRARGWTPVPLKGKNPGLNGENWQSKPYQSADFAGGGNVGIILGRSGLADIDLDCPEARAAAPHFLLDTQAVFGRDQTGPSHCLYKADETLPTTAFRDPLTQGMLLEYRAGTGSQTMFPPSVHPDTRETVRWMRDGEPAAVSAVDLLERVKKVAASALPARYWPEKGARHDASLALAGGLARAGWQEADLDRFLGAVATAAGDPEIRDRKNSAGSTATAINMRRNVTGWPRLAELLRADGNKIITKVMEWLGIERRAYSTDTITTAGGADLAEVAAEANEREQVSIAGDPAPPKYSDDDLALRFASRHKDSSRFSNEWGVWLHYRRGRWEKDIDKQFFDMSRALCREAAEEYLLTHPEPKPGTAKDLASSKKVAAVITMASSDRRLAAVGDQFDADPLLLNTPGGTVDLRTGELRDHRPHDLLTKMAGAAPLPDWRGNCPVFTSYISRSCRDDGELISFLQRLCGYFLTGSIKDQIVAFVQGPGATGKSIFWNMLMGILADYARRMPTEMLMDSGPSERHPTDLAGLKGCRLAVASEVPSSCRWNEEKLKEYSGGDVVTARFMRQDYFEYKPQFKMLIAANHKPTLRSVGEDMRRRLILIPFTNQVPPEQRDPDLPAKIQEEWPAVLAWMIEGCLAWQQTGLRPPETVLLASGEYFESQDHFGNWLKERCLTGPQCADTKVGLLYADYKQYCEGAGIRPMTLTGFGYELSERGFEKSDRTKKGVLVRNTILRTDASR
jgi:putative DNA primase/helicase